MNIVVPTGAALSEQIAELTRGLAQLDRTRDDHLYELGRKLIPIRQLLQAANRSSSGKPGADGLRPRGWKAWCNAAGINTNTAAHAVRRACDPEGSRAKASRLSTEKSRTPVTAIRSLRRAWPNWTNEERAKVIAAVRELAQESNRGA